MARVKIDYGIDLGTTNSAIARMENGEVKIIKSDTQKDTTPSCVYCRKNTILIGDTAYARYGDEHMEAFKEFSLTRKEMHKFNTFIEFKTTMGTDNTFECNSTGRTFNSEELSSEVLKALKNYVRDEEISSVVVTVPARFRNNQIDATQKAAELSGFKYCELLQEPIAASIAYGVKADNINGYWLVFDFGGGTFDAALMRVEEGIMKVVDTEGDNHLGGKDLDYAVVDHIIIPYLKNNYQIETLLNSDYGKYELRETLKGLAEEAKIAISVPSKTSTEIFTTKPIGEDDNGNDIDFEFQMSLEEYENAVAPIFQRAIDISKKLIESNQLDSTDLKMVLLVGGPTLSQTLRRMLKEQLKTKINTSIDPMTSIAVGAALFASSIDIPASFQKRNKNKTQLILKYPNTTVETEENLGIKIDRENTLGEIPKRIFAEINRKDKAWSSGKVEIVDDAEIISLLLLPGKSNGFEIKLYDDKGNPLPCEPSSFTIMQGFKEPPATLPFDLGIEAFAGDNEKKLLNGFPGLGKNQSLPAKGKDVFKTQKDIRPGNSEDIIKIPIYEGKLGSQAILNWPAGIVFITGEQLPKFLPKGSDVEITLEVNKSRGIHFKAYFPDIDETFEKDIKREDQQEYDKDEMNNEIDNSKKLLAELEKNSDIADLPVSRKLRAELNELKNILENGGNDYDTKLKVKERLRNALIELDKIESDGEFPKAEEELNSALHDLKVTNQRYGNNQTTKTVEQFEELAIAAIKETNLRTAKELASQIRSFDLALVDAGAGVAFEISFIKNFDDDFDSLNWKNKNQARQLINDAKQIIATNPTKPKLRPIVSELFKLLPEPERPKLSDKDDEFLTR